MLVKGQGVDHGDGRLCRKLDRDLVRSSSDDDRVHEAIEVSGDIGDGLPDAPADVA